MKKKDKKMLLWGALGIGALWFLSRPKAAPATKQPAPRTTSTNYQQSTNSAASVGLPYTYNAEI